MAKEVLLQMKSISKSFTGVQALNQARFELYKGEVHALVGENGAGKSTLMKILLGICSLDEGEIIYKGKAVVFKSPHDALQSGISMIHQEISLVPTLDVAENIWMGREDMFRRFGLLNTGKRFEATKALLHKLEINIDPKSLIKNLSVANMQLVELARAVSYESDIIIMDEPTSALTDSEIKLLYKIVRDLSSAGVSIIFISHKLEEIFEICDRVSVLRDGQWIGTKQSREISNDELIKLIVGREMKDMYPKSATRIGRQIMKVENLCKNGVFTDVSFTLNEGEIIGFCGLMGAGRTEIARAVFGIDQCDSGSIEISGKQVKITSPEKAIALGLGMVTEDRLRQGAIHDLSVRANMSLSYLKNISNKLRLINFRKEKDDCVDMVKKLSVLLSSINQPIKSLSGGNQQKVIIGRWLLTQPKILILDEPTRGIDVGSKSEIHRLISELASRGLAIIMISSELPEILGMSDRIIVVRKGKIVLDSPRQDVDQEILMAHAFGA